MPCLMISSEIHPSVLLVLFSYFTVSEKVPLTAYCTYSFITVGIFISFFLMSAFGLISLFAVVAS